MPPAVGLTETSTPIFAFISTTETPMPSIFRIKTLGEMHSLLGYPPPKHPLISWINFEEQCPSVALKPGMRLTADFYGIMLKKCKPGSLKYGRTTYDFQEDTLIFLAPGQVVSAVEEDENEENRYRGWGLFFHPELLRRSELQQLERSYSFFAYSTNEALHLSEKEQEVIEGILKNIEEEYSQNLDDYSHELILTTLTLLLNYCKRFYGRQFLTRKNKNLDLLTEFERLLGNYFEEALENGLPTIPYFAEKLNLSANYLSDLLKKETGKSAKEHLHLALMERAKHRLLNSSASVSEIAYELGFEYPQYFSKLFRQKVGMTPVAYRKAS